MCKQLTIVTTDRVGVLADILAILSDKGINIEDIEGRSINAWAVVRLRVDRYDDAIRIFSGTDYTALADRTLLVRVADRPGALAQIAKRFKDAGIGLQSVRIVGRDDDASLVALSVEQDKAARVLVHDVLLS